MIAPSPTPALVATRLGVVLAGCPDCRLPIGLAGAPGIDGAVAAHRVACDASACPRCWQEAPLALRGGELRCAECWAAAVLELPVPAVVARARPKRARRARRGRAEAVAARHVIAAPAGELYKQTGERSVA